ncbi:hypothetical protein [Neptuniibacter sp. QD34_54]|uniref:hypothetical protein n=1 Tax=Neptuniibacter sp. QD34_54 TaxID=3398208 RepID=UPI0039F56F7E
MEDLERNIILWLLDTYPSEREAFASQLLGAKVTEREFTNGGGVFITFKPNQNSMPVSSNFLDGLTRTNGPEISSPELQHGATVDIEFDNNGIVDYVEIWAMAGDYPNDRHPDTYVFAKP